MNSLNNAIVNIDTTVKKASIKCLHGIFLEDISHAVHRGLYAEIRQNASFENGIRPYPHNKRYQSYKRNN